MLSQTLFSNVRERSWPDLQKIHSAGKHRLGIISDILDLSKIEAGKMEFAPEVFDAAGPIRELAATMRPDMEASQALLPCHEIVGSGTTKM